MRRAILSAAAVMAALTTASATAQGAIPQPIPLRSGWEIRDLTTPPTPAQPAPPVEGAPASARAARSIPAQPAQASGDWHPATVPGAFSGVARRAEYGGTVKQYRLRFTPPDVEGYTWAFAFEQARRRAVVSLNGKRIGISIDPYTPFQIPARGLRPGEENTLEVVVDSRKDPRLPEGWWNWGGITRPVTLIPVGKANLRDLGLLPHVRCAGPATGCEGSLLIDGVLDKLPRERGPQPLPGAELAIQLRPPGGRMTPRRFFDLRGARSGRRRNRIQIAVPHPRLWSPDRPQLYDARVEVRYDGELVQVEKRRIGFRAVAVKDGVLTLNNRPINLRGASIHEDFPGRGAALRGYEMDTIVRELKELGANVTRSHYVLSEGLLRRFDRAGIMVYDQAPVWQRDHGANLLRTTLDRQRAVAQVRRTVLAARNHPSVIVHSVANELTFTPDQRPRTRRFLLDAAAAARDLDPWLPISLDIKTRAYLPRQSTYDAFDLIGINQYFGWYQWVEDFNQLEPFLELMRSYYPEHALVMTEFGAEGRPDMAAAPATEKGSYGFQAQHVARTMDLVDRLPFMSGAIHWTLREFEIYPGWRGGAVPASGPNDNIRHHKGVLTYDGARKPAWQQLHDRFARVPLYR
jgi:beta-glucuronidase